MDPDTRQSTPHNDMNVTYAISVNREQCVCDGLCREKAPNTFGHDDEGKTIVVDPSGDTAKDIFSAAESCRMYAIILRDIHTNEQVWP